MSETGSSTTSWSTWISGHGDPLTASILVSTNGGPKAVISLQGVCYSPAPINGSNSTAPLTGDYYWDSYSGTGYNITGWEALWARDLPKIRALNCNCIRVYSMLSRHLNSNGTFPDPWNSGNHFTHKTFLDMCWNGGVNPIYVMVGIPMPEPYFWKEQYGSLTPNQLAFWNGILQETAADLADHPAVMGFIVQNEMDDPTHCWQNTSYADFWWSQVEAAASKVRATAPNKLVGMAVHDMPGLRMKSQGMPYHKKAPSLQYYGVNTYQTITFNSIFQGVAADGDGGYNQFPTDIRRPVIFTEYGIPATGHKNPSDPSTIYESSMTRTNTANCLATTVPMIAQNPMGPRTYPLLQGMFYFEFCDEWWNQPGSPNIYTWWGGAADSGFPNGFWDQDGFGLYSIKRGGTLPNDAPIWIQNGGIGYPNTPIDVHTKRPETSAIIQNAYAPGLMLGSDSSLG